MQLAFPVDSGGPALKLWSPSGGHQDSGQDTRIIDPGVTPSLFEQLAAEHQSGPKRIPDSELPRVRFDQTLPEFYAEWMAPWRDEQRIAKEVKSGTLSKERQALNRWTKWELENRPPSWPDGKPWKGCPIGYIAGGYLDRFYSALPKLYAKDTVESTRNHIRTVLNFARIVGALGEVPQAKPLDLEDPDDVEDELATVWTDDEINRLYLALAPHPELQSAFVLSCSAGPRSVDLFTLRWEKNLRLEESPPRLRFRARKSGKKHGIPLADFTVAHLQRLQRQHLFDPAGAIFPTLGSIQCQDPEKSHAARRRNTLMKRCMRSAGVPDHARPWQVCRATCCTRLNNVRPGAGSWVIGQSADTSRAGTKLAADHYDNPTEAVIDAILRAPVPEAFAEGAARLLTH